MKDFDQLSKRQQNILRFIDRYFNDNGFPPTIRQIGEATDIGSTSVVNYNLNKLVDAGYLERKEATSRGLRLLRPIPGGTTQRKVAAASTKMLILHAGRIAAGIPLEVPQDIAHTPDPDNALEVTGDMIGSADPSEVFALTVKGDSMIDAMIQDGDTVILRATRTANNGDMVAAWLPERGETTLKYFFREKDGRIRLQPAHPTMDPIYVDPANCEIHGKVLSVLRCVK
jgi:repressor LexA